MGISSAQEKEKVKAALLKEVPKEKDNADKDDAKKEDGKVRQKTGEKYAEDFHSTFYPKTKECPLKRDESIVFQPSIFMWIS